MNRSLLRQSLLACTSLALLGGCQTLRDTRTTLSSSLGTGETFAIYGLEGRWAGKTTPDTPDCVGPTTAILTVGSDGFALDPFASTFVIDGKVSAGGAFAGTLTRDVAGAGNKHIERKLTFDGQVRKQSDGSEQIDGRLQSGRCSWHVSLRRA
ncbi:hypothetical protein [Acidisphaera rubrifaciens]|uniref:Lipoprotein n=1 Tax=Acidisphaera rubrifaciens HS-AP3 TaxID=1231350 RepID=A0A0D6P3N3_9PROT|nr:hypothetical protein [Acidisphaera rubrifaciens]GAN76370.1 hypothetical protein Asru_0086_46 [Acidisphaera rubrifaciens HS-AP3]